MAGRLLAMRLVQLLALTIPPAVVATNGTDRPGEAEPFSPGGETATQGTGVECVDQEERWAEYGTSCTEMKLLCDDDGYGSHVREWCPKMCGLCNASRNQNASSENTYDHFGGPHPRVGGTSVASGNTSAGAIVDGGNVLPLPSAEFRTRFSDADGNVSATVVIDEEAVIVVTGNKWTFDADADSGNATAGSTTDNDYIAWDSSVANMSVNADIATVGNASAATTFVDNGDGVDGHQTNDTLAGRDNTGFNGSVAPCLLGDSCVIDNTTAMMEAGALATRLVNQSVDADNVSDVSTGTTLWRDEEYISQTLDHHTLFKEKVPDIITQTSVRRKAVGMSTVDASFMLHVSGVNSSKGADNVTLAEDVQDEMESARPDSEIFVHFKASRLDDVDRKSPTDTETLKNVSGITARVHSIGTSIPVESSPLDDTLLKKDRQAAASGLKASNKPLGTAVDEELRSCPVGYELVEGDVHGGDQWTGRHKIFASSLQACAGKCSATPGCGSFEYSPSTKRCFRNSQTRPTSSKGLSDFMFCRRRPCPSFKTEESCVGPEVEPGGQSLEVALRPGSYCIWSAGACQAPMMCSPTDCWLPDGGLPGMDLPPSKTLWVSAATMSHHLVRSAVHLAR
eukprot:TRINITY_DN75605_c0_g1_i1.p1 TRINITY_DN75605_c0_g1~~TRINITY_DN75605_c0_g1_i1.p1  ORF type:complete len:625 (+),score=106.32 TRINITY_DN75605_c0_g1_i1:50-1924(+)